MTEAVFQEKRRYVRMRTVFPVEFEVFDGSGESLRSPVCVQGFTSNVSAGGMCLEFKEFGLERPALLLVPESMLQLTINTPFSSRPILAKARVVWMRHSEQVSVKKIVMGIAYTQIDEADRKRILNYAKGLLWLPRLTIFSFLILLGIAGVLYARNQKLVVENRSLITRLVETAERKSHITASLLQLKERRNALDRDGRAAMEKIGMMETALRSLAAENQKQKTDYEDKIRESRKKQQTIAAELEKIKRDSQKLESAYLTLHRAGQADTSVAFRQMGQWLIAHQNVKTGLVSSFEGDEVQKDNAYTYDQSLSCQTFLILGEFDRAKDVLAFYRDKAQTREGLFFNAYDAVSGSVAESALHTGPNVWIGLAALRYARVTKDGSFTETAKRIGDWLVRFQDAEGGFRGGPDDAWYSTEHNLDAYAFLRALHGASQEKAYGDAAERTLVWIKKYAYSNPGRLNRGKGDATIATDTFSWAVAALGPTVLKRLGFDPDAIMEFAEKNCEVTADYRDPAGRMIKVKGFDFAKAMHLGRGGIVSTEWTAQMIVSYQVMAEHYRREGAFEKSRFYGERAVFFRNELQKLIITSPSRTGQGRGCLPYASADNADTGHGWRTPKGTRTGSVAGTAYAVFAWTGYNPFDAEREPSHKSIMRDL